MKTVLNGIFKSSGATPVRMQAQMLTEEDIIQHVPKYERTERTKSQPKYTPSRPQARPVYEPHNDLMQVEQVWKSTNFNYGALNSQSEEKAQEKAKLMERRDVLADDYQSQRNDLPQNQQLQQPPVEITKSPEPPVRQRLDVVDVKESEVEVVYKKEDLKTPEKSAKKRVRLSEPRYHDEVSNFNLSSPNTELTKEPDFQEELKEDNFKQIVDSEILFKEYELGRELLAKASEKIDYVGLLNLISDDELSNKDFQILYIYLSLLFSVFENRDHIVSSWEETYRSLKNYKGIHELQSNFTMMIENKNFRGEQTFKFRDAFVSKSTFEPANPIIGAIKEYLCEAF